MRPGKESVLGAGVVLAGLAVVSSWGPRQVGDVNPVNCGTGPKKGETELVLRRGEDLEIGGTSGILGMIQRQSLRLESQGNGAFGIRSVDSTDGLTSDPDITVPANPDKSIQINGVSVRADNTVIFDSNDLNFQIKGSDADGDTRLNVVVSCQE